jgi:DNA repair exonuclease SbcCD ATPase subunit
MSRTSTTGQESPDTELSLRRQLARLQRQLAEAQLELSRKDEELANEVEQRMTFGAEHLELLAAHRQVTARVDELTATHGRLEGVEQRLLDAVTTAEELAHQLDKERSQREQSVVRVVELTAAMDEAIARWTSERATLEDSHAAELAEIESQKRMALDAAEEAIVATNMRLRQANDDQLAQQRGSHERSLAALRGELEPKVLEARNLAEERQRLANEIAELRTANARDLAEREEAHKRELAQIAEANASQQAQQTRLFLMELTRAQEDRDAKGLALEQAQRNTEQRERLWEETTSALRETQKKLQIEAAEAKELGARLASEKASAEERLASSVAAYEHLIGEQRALQERLASSEAEARQHEIDRRRFAAYLEEGLALVGALPPAPVRKTETDDDTEITIEGGTQASDGYVEVAQDDIDFAEGAIKSDQDTHATEGDIQTAKEDAHETEGDTQTAKGDAQGTEDDTQIAKGDAHETESDTQIAKGDAPADGGTQTAKSDARVAARDSEALPFDE